MKFSVNQQDIQKSLSYCQGVIEKRSTLPILSNILLEINSGNLIITATDLDLIFIHKISNVEILEEGKTTTTSSIMYDIIRKFSSGSKINFSSPNENKLQLESEKSIFNLNCISASEFPLMDENFNQNEFSIKSKDLLKLLNKCKFSVSNDETRHYLSGIFFHQTQSDDKVFLTAAATDSHRMSISKIRLENKIDFEPIILPKKTIFQLCSLLEDYEGDVKVSNIKSKIKFQLHNSILISKLIDGKFPNYMQVIPKENQKKLQVNLKSFLNSVDRVASVSLDKKDGVKFSLTKDTLNLSVNNTNSGDGKESLGVKFDHDLDISFNSRYLIDVASQLDGEKIELFLNDTGSPALIKDPGDFDNIRYIEDYKGNIPVLDIIKDEITINNYKINKILPHPRKKIDKNYKYINLIEDTNLIAEDFILSYLDKNYSVSIYTSFSSCIIPFLNKPNIHIFNINIKN